MIVGALLLLQTSPVLLILPTNPKDTHIAYYISQSGICHECIAQIYTSQRLVEN